MGALEEQHAAHKARWQRMLAAAKPETAKVVAPPPPKPEPVETPIVSINGKPLTSAELKVMIRDMLEPLKAPRPAPEPEPVKAKPAPPPPEEPLTRVPTIGHIKKVVADAFGISVVDMESHRRTKNVIRPRQVAMYLARKLTRHSLPAISKQFGGRDHTTTLSSVRRIERKLVEDPSLNARVRELQASLEGTFCSSSVFNAPAGNEE